jgi:hypothetical protein
MALPLKLLAAMTTTAAAASAAAYIAVSSRSTAASQSSAPRAAQTRPANTNPAAPGGEVKLCVGSDQILHANRAGQERCPEGLQEIDLARVADEQVCDSCDPLKDQPPAEPASDDAALDAIEQRIRELEQRPYFEVVNEAGELILQVTAQGMRVFHNGRAMVVVGMTDIGAYLHAASATGPWSTSIGTSGDSAGIVFHDRGAPRAELGTRGGPFGLRFPSGDGLIAGIGESRAGTGAVVVGTRAGRMQAAMMVSGTRGMVSVFEQPGAGGVTLAESAIGGGLLRVDDWMGNPAVKMGHNDNRYGVVLAGPVLGPPMVPRLGVIGSYFMGCASGERPACMPSVPDR